MFTSLLIGSIVIGGVYGLLALGYSLIYRASGLLSFAQGDMLMLGGMLGLTFYKSLKLPFAVAFVVVALCMFAVGFMTEKCVVRPVLKRKGTTAHVVLITIGLSILIQNIVLLVYNSDIKMFPEIFRVSTVKFAGLRIPPESLLAIAVALVAMVVLHLFMNFTRMGTSMRAAAQDEIAAGAYGINVSRVKGTTWGIAGALAGISGMIIGPVYGVHMGMGIGLGVKAFAAAIVGGYGNLYGAMVGGLILGTVETFSGGYISSQSKDFMVFFVLILFLIIKPRGIFNVNLIDT